MERNAQGQHIAEPKPEAMLSQVATHYYTLRMGEREIGGTNKDALKRFARKHGYRVTERKTLRAADWTRCPECRSATSRHMEGCSVNLD